MIVQMLPHPTSANVVIGARAADSARKAIIVPEMSELAQQLRSLGWVARAGWFSHAPAGQVWLVRLEAPAAPVACG